MRSIDLHAEQDTLCRRIHEFAKLEAGWNGDDSVAPNEAVIAEACKIVRELPDNAQLPHVSPSADGEIGLSWLSGNKRLEALIQPEGYLVLVRALDHQLTPVAEINLRERSSSPLLEEVAALYR
jgi:hypothetical protein